MEMHAGHRVDVFDSLAFESSMSSYALVRKRRASGDEDKTGGRSCISIRCVRAPRYRILALTREVVRHP